MLSKRRIHLWYFNPAGNYGVKTHSHDQTSPFVLHRDRLPELHSTDNVSDPIAKIRLVDPVGQSEWYLVEYNYETQLAYGLAITEDYPEGRMGYIHLDELRQCASSYELANCS
jgi:hypothetical protein